jgi:UDP-N-acetylmuramoyl-L-alanyl-D-glutamate--2,6-diaminopimelate ligase
MAIESRVQTRVSKASSLAELAEVLDDVTVLGNGSTEIREISYDSRSMQEGNLFVALRGGYFDGHDFTANAVENGAAALMVEEQVESEIPQLVVPNSRAALAKVAAFYFENPSQDLTVVGVTGTDGKTTTTYLIDDILRSTKRVTGAIGTVSVRIAGEIVEHETRQTTPESLDVQRYLRHMVDAGVDTAILEATSHGLDLHRLDETKFDIAAVTNITHEHLEHHGSIAAYRRAKAILFERVANTEGSAVINLDDPGAQAMVAYSGKAKVLTYSCLDRNATIFADSIALKVDGSSFKLVIGGNARNCRIPLVGGFNVSNALCAAGLATALGIDIDGIASGLELSTAVPGRMARVDVGQPFSVIVDYAHTPDSLSKVLQLLRGLNPNGRLIAVSGSAGERDVEKRSLQGAVSQLLADISIFTTEDPRFEDPDAIISQIAAGAREQGGTPGESYHCITDRRDAVAFALSLAEPRDVVLLAGKGHERSNIWGLEKRPWDEAAVARELLIEMGYGVDP